MRRGHAVTLFAHPESKPPCPLVPYPNNQNGSMLRILRNACPISSRTLRGEFDLIHSFGRLAYLAPLLPLRIPKLMTYQREITARTVRWAETASNGTLQFTGCSRHLIRDFAGQAGWHVVYNGVSPTAYDFVESVSDSAPLVFLGRLEEIKGPHLAIEVAKRSGRRLILAGNIPEEAKHRSYVEQEILPHVDGDRIQYVGPVDDRQKNEILGHAAALLMPILWEEPFGIVMAESLACGTPVIGLARGSVPEVVEEGLTGFVCRTIDEMAAAVSKLEKIDRTLCRQAMEQRFSASRMTDAFEALYFQMLRGNG